MKKIRVVIDETHQFVRYYDVEDDFDVDNDDEVGELVDGDEQLTDGFTEIIERLTYAKIVEEQK